MDWSFARPLFCGAIAGLAVDLTLYPLDTIKTRLQCAEGFAAAGGLRNIYRGLGSVVVGSAPSAALFFSSYSILNQLATAVVHACSASVSEVVACLVRVPTELVKQRAQAKDIRSLGNICQTIYCRNVPFLGFWGFYQGFRSTVLREVPFSFIEFPVWEALKEAIKRNRGRQCSPAESATCGSVAGSFAAAMTTPLDVAKTRIMLNEDTVRPGIFQIMVKVWKTSGYRGLYAGIVPRSIWMGIGGFVFFGAFETTMLLSKRLFL